MVHSFTFPPQDFKMRVGDTPVRSGTLEPAGEIVSLDEQARRISLKLGPSRTLLGDAAFFVAPIVSGTGIKTKVLEAMAIGLPVLATRHAVAGLKVEHKKHCFVCERPAEFSEGMQYLSNPFVAEEMGLNAREYVQANFSIDVLRQRWSDVIHDLTASAGASNGRSRAYAAAPLCTEFTSWGIRWPRLTNRRKSSR